MLCTQFNLNDIEHEKKNSFSSMNTKTILLVHTNSQTMSLPVTCRVYVFCVMFYIFLCVFMSNKSPALGELKIELN